MNLKVKPQETIDKLMEHILDKERAKPSNVRLDVSNLTCDHCDGVINKYLLKYISVDIDVII